MSDEESGAGGAERASSGGGSALKALISFFTIWHMDIDERDMNEMERNFGLIPFVGVLFGVVIMIVMAIFCYVNKTQGFGSGMFYAVLVLAIVYVGSKFIHFDGLTDFGDGMIVSGTQEDHVRALKDTLVGAGGIGVALIVVLLSVSIYGIAGLMLIVFAPIAEILVKNAMVAAAAYGKPGNGMAARQVSLTTTHFLIVSTVLSLVLSIVLGIVAGLIYNAMYPNVIELVSVLFCIVFGTVVSILVGYLMARKANSVFGMVNGDILGATNEISRPAIMFVMILPYICWLW